jgi:glycosyltransferase involved in cell wall biosynthesis
MSSKNFGEAPQQPHFQNDIRKLLFFGSMQSYKGIDLLIRAFEELIEEGVTNLRLSIFGKFATQTYQEECQAMIKHPEFYNLSYQFVDNKDIPSLFASHDFTMFPYRDATQSGPLMINVNYGLPIVAPNHTCFADTYVNGETAFLYNDSLDYRSLKEALRRTSTISKAEYEAMLKQCEVLKDTYSEENIAKNYIRVFNRILAD